MKSPCPLRVANKAVIHLVFFKASGYTIVVTAYCVRSAILEKTLPVFAEIFFSKSINLQGPAIVASLVLLPAYIAVPVSSKPVVFYITLESNIGDYVPGTLLAQIPCLPEYYR